MNRKICVITGANAGIGKQAAIQIAGKGYHIVLACRSRERVMQAFDEVLKMNSSNSAELLVVDMGLKESIKNFAGEFKSRYERLDVLIHNAAIFNVTQKQRETTSEGFETVWATNHLGPVLMTELLMDCLKKSENGRIITISSKGLLAKPFLKVDLYDPEFKLKKFSIVNAYYQSKLAQLMYTYWLSDRLRNTAITANCIRVTAVKIDISRHPGLSPFMKWLYSVKARNSLSPEAMAGTYVFLAISDRVGKVSGKYFDEKNLEVNPNKYCKAGGNIKAVMRLTKKYVPEIKET